MSAGAPTARSNHLSVFTVPNIPFASPSRRRWSIAALVAIIGLVAGCMDNPPSSNQSNAEAYQDDQSFQSSRGVTAYIGVTPAAIVRGYNVEDTESSMHGGAPSGRHDYHLVIAAFDAATGERISNAVVKARISDPDLVGDQIALEPMSIAGTVTYGGFVSFPSTAPYVIRIDVEQPDGASASFDFTYNHQPP